MGKSIQSHVADNLPGYARIRRIDYGHQEVMAYTQKDPREYCVLTKRFISDDQGNLTGIDTVRVEWENISGQWKMEEIKGTEKTYSCQLALLALGFLGPQKEVAEAFAVKQDARTNIQTPTGVRRASQTALTIAGLLYYRSRSFRCRRLPSRTIVSNRSPPPPPPSPTPHYPAPSTHTSTHTTHTPSYDLLHIPPSSQTSSTCFKHRKEC